MDQQVVTPGTQLAEQFPFPREALQRAERFPVPAHYVKLGERGVPVEHRRGVVVDQRVDLELRRVRLERSEHGRGQQHVAVVPQLHHQRAPALP
jgi:hypothetical protein